MNYPKVVLSRSLIEVMSSILMARRNKDVLPKCADGWMKYAKKHKEILVCIDLVTERDDLFTRAFDFGYMLAAFKYKLKMEPWRIDDSEEIVLADLTVVSNKLKNKALIRLQPLTKRVRYRKDSKKIR